MGHVDEGHPEVALERLEEHLHLLAELQVERAERLVEQQHLGLVHDRPRERDPLALAARELDRLAVAEGRRAAPSRAPRSTLAAALAAPDAAHAQAVADVLGDGHVREERVVLEDRVDVAGVGRKVR